MLDRAFQLLVFTSKPPLGVFEGHLPTQTWDELEEALRPKTSHRAPKDHKNTRILLWYVVYGFRVDGR